MAVSRYISRVVGLLDGQGGHEWDIERVLIGSSEPDRSWVTLVRAFLYASSEVAGRKHLFHRIQEGPLNFFVGRDTRSSQS